MGPRWNTKICHPRNCCGGIFVGQVSDLLDGKYSDVVDEVKIIDCRFPYEYRGGHIKGAVHMDDAREMPDFFFGPPLAERTRTVIIFHCEYSQSRGPRMCVQEVPHFARLSCIMRGSLHPPCCGVLYY